MTPQTKTKIIKGDLILKKDTIFKTGIKVEGNIRGHYNLKVAGNIDAWNIDAKNIDAWNIDAKNIVAGNIDAKNIDAWNIDAWNIVAGNIDAWNIDAWNIVAGNIDAWNIDAKNIDAWNIDAWNIVFCDKIKVKQKVICKVLIKDRFSIDKKEWKI
jgi:hypothetical protein